MPFTSHVQGAADIVLAAIKCDLEASFLKALVPQINTLVQKDLDNQKRDIELKIARNYEYKPKMYGFAGNCKFLYGVNILETNEILVVSGIAAELKTQKNILLQQYTIPKGLLATSRRISSGFFSKN